MRIATTLSIVTAIALAAEAERDAVPWTEAARHVGRIVVVEGDVRAVEREGRRLTLIFDPGDPRALRVTLLIPLVTDLPPAPEALYRERTVRVHGRVTRTAGHLDVVVTDPDRIAVVGLGADDTRPPGPDVRPAPSPPADRPVERTAHPVPPSPPVPAPAPSPPADTTCERLRASHETARRDALAAVGALQHCLESGGTGCAGAADEVASPLARLEWIEQQRRARCAAGF